jgi:uncharacterized spore protein YtfJ
MELETSRTTEASASFTVGERVFHVVTEVLTVRNTKGNIFAVSVSPIALLVLEPPDHYSISLTDQELTAEELLIMVPALNEKILAKGGAASRDEHVVP